MNVLSDSAENLRKKIKELREEIVRLRNEKKPLLEDWESSRKEKRFGALQALKNKGTLHFKDTGRISGIGFGNNSSCITLCSGTKAPCGSIIEWDCNQRKAERFHVLTDQWQTCFELERMQNELFVTGDLNNEICIYNLNAMDRNEDEMVPPASVLRGHTAVIDAITFVEPENVISASGDKTLRLWNVPRQECIHTFVGHTSNATSVSRHPDTDVSIFVSGGADFTARVWDTREISTGQEHRAQASLTFDTRSRDINDVCFFPDGNVFGAALNNSETHLYDIRASCKMLTFKHQSTYHKCPAEQVKFSSSGRLMFVRYGDGTFVVYDVAGPVTSDTRGNVYNENKVNVTLPSHPVKMIEVSPTGSVFGAGLDYPSKVDTAVDLYWPSGKMRR